jgi:AbrB family looped-hinge helix DNA binding protein
VYVRVLHVTPSLLTLNDHRKLNFYYALLEGMRKYHLLIIYVSNELYLLIKYAGFVLWELGLSNKTFLVRTLTFAVVFQALPHHLSGRFFKNRHLRYIMVYYMKVTDLPSCGKKYARCHMLDIRAKLAEGGRIVIPVEYRQALGLHVGDEVILRLENGEVRIFTPQQAIKRAQELVRRYVPEERSLSDELLEERKMEREG